ncbi:MAG: DNA polymerase III subunit delta' [Desulfuromonas sp.]|nr:MAG: DNA polymerase III subunit delta' [Desulfuromonas sp.]
MTFARILGHERQKDILRRAVKSNRLAQAYLFEGPDGVGKELMAQALARMVFCADGDGCGDCPACRKVDHHNHPDLHLLEADGKFIKIEQVRELQREMALRPLEAPRKIALIVGAERMNQAAGNALLKTLEEPNGASLFILMTHQPERLLSTIRSRCQRLQFGHLPLEKLKQALTEKLGLDDTEGHLLATLAEGSFKKALGRDREFFIEQRRELLKRVTALSAGSVLPLFELAKQLNDDKESLPDVLELLLAFYRDLLLFAHARPEQELVNIDLMEKIRREAGRHNVTALLRKLEAVIECRRHLERNVNSQLAIEVLLMRLAA